MMKKRTKVLILLLACFALTACSPIHFYYAYEDLRENVVEIELIMYDNTQVREVRNFRTHPNFDFGRVEHVQILENEHVEAFLQYISDEMILNHLRHDDSPNGKSVILRFHNGDFDVISERYIGRFNSAGEFVQYMGIFDSRNHFVNILDLFFPESNLDA